MPVTSYVRTKQNRFDRYERSYYSVNNGGYIPYSIITAPLNPGQTSQSGVRDTDWRLKVSKRQNAAYPYMHSIYEVHRPFVLTARSRFREFGSTIDSFMEKADYGAYTISFPNVSDIQAIALTRFRRKLASQVGNAKLLVPLVELRELRSTINRTCSIATEYLQAVAQAKRSKGRSVAKFVQDTWLNFSFGISPTIGDTLSAIQAVERWLSVRRPLARLSASASQSSFTRSVLPGGGGNMYYLSLDVTNQVNVVQTCTFASGIDFKLIFSNDYSLRQHLGLTEVGAKLPSIAWELMPFSWVFDYFGTMGAYLEDVFESPPGEPVYLTRTTKSVWDATSTVSMRRVANVQWVYSSIDHMQPGHIRYVSTVRDVLQTIPARPLRLKTLDEAGLGSIKKLLNLASFLGR